MSKRERGTKNPQANTTLDLSHLRRDARTALELAIVAMAPTELVDRLATATGLLEALVELPSDSAPVLAIAPKVAVRGRTALEDWQKWQQEHYEKKFPRG